jgi:uncharacterized protein
MTDPALTIALRNMAATKVAMTMRWRDLLFLHFAYNPAAIQKMLPNGLTIDTFPEESGQEVAWIGLVPFRMEAVRPRGMPNFKPCTDFPETNVRTYCHLDGKDPGVWFFSLDASNTFACTFARQFFRLNYKEAAMTVDRRGSDVHYESKRWFKPAAQNSVHCRLGEPIGTAKPGTLEFFLLERYLLYSVKGDQLYHGQVFHQPYPITQVVEFKASGSLIEANGLDPMPFSHALFSEGVDVSAGRIVSVK